MKQKIEEAAGARDTLLPPVQRPRVASFDTDQKAPVVTSLSVDEQTLRSTSMENISKIEPKSKSLKLPKAKWSEAEVKESTATSSGAGEKTKDETVARQRRTRPPNLRSLREKVAGSKRPLHRTHRAL